jgi:hypothetical protein
MMEMFSRTLLMGGKCMMHHPTGPFMEKWMMAMGLTGPTLGKNRLKKK